MLNSVRQDASLMHVIDDAQSEFRTVLSALYESQGCLTRSQYAAYLGMQTHLTRSVQKYFLRIAAHPAVMKRAGLRRFVMKFAVEEAPHYRIAMKDLEALGEPLCEVPFAVELWHAYFSSIVDARPFVRLGAACYLENVAGKSSDVIERLFAGSTYLRPNNMRFFLIHKHETDKLDHGNMILDALRQANLRTSHWADLAEGAAKARILYKMMMDWALSSDSPKVS